MRPKVHSQRTALVASALYRNHDPGPRQFESPKRIDAILKALAPDRLGIELPHLVPRRATREEILLCHTPAYFDSVQQDCAAGRTILTHGDTNISRDSFEAALLAAGGALTAVDAIMEGQVDQVFCAIRPPGHHAVADQGTGYCIFNNAAIAARYAQRNHGLARVLIVDWDVHHGNGTQEIFYEDPSVFFFSTHQWPLYPGSGRAEETGAGAGRGTTLNCPLARHSGRREFVGAYMNRLVPAADQFQPELLVISAGFDSRQGDPLGRLSLEDDDFAELTRILQQIAHRHAQGRVLSLLEGGYRRAGLASAVSAHVRALATDSQ